MPSIHLSPALFTVVPFLRATSPRDGHVRLAKHSPPLHCSEAFISDSNICLQAHDKSIEHSILIMSFYVHVRLDHDEVAVDLWPLVPTARCLDRSAHGCCRYDADDSPAWTYVFSDGRVLMLEPARDEM